MRLFILSWLLLLNPFPARLLASNCPTDCSCPIQGTIFCINRRSASMPRDVDPLAQYFYLFQNGIETLSPEDFSGLDSLETLDLSQNKLMELPDDVFQPLSSLRNLDLSSNHITHISEGSFSGLVLLERLYLRGNQIQSIHPAAFDGLEHLLELKLQENHLTILPAFHMSNLLLLDLSFNHVPPPNPTDLQTPNLESLKMVGLGFDSLDDDLFVNLYNLHDLDISQNKLKSVPRALREGHGLTKLNLARNPVGQIKLEDFQNLEKLSELDISNLNLQGFPEGFDELFPLLRRLTAAENPFNCLCQLAWFPRWLLHSQVNLSRTEETRCHFPPLNAGKLLERLDHRDFGCPTTTTLATSTTSSTTRPVGTTTSLTTHVVPTPRPPIHHPDSIGTDSHLPPPDPSTSESDPKREPKVNFCPSYLCLNGGTCQLDRQGELECICPRGTSGAYCENVDVSIPDGPVEPDISSREVTSTTISLDLYRYFEAKPYIRAIRLTYRNLSGPDRRPIHLNVPDSYPEYTLRGLRPNSTYSICASIPGEPDDVGPCTEAHTADPFPTHEAHIHTGQFTSMLIPTLLVPAILIAVAVVVGILCYLRRKKSKDHIELECDPSPLELEGVKACLDNGALPQKQPDFGSSPPLVPNGLEYEVPLMQAHCTSNNNLAALKPSYF